MRLVRMGSLLLLLALLLLPSFVLGQSVEEEVRRDVGRLASREMHGRGYDRDGHLKAAEYIRERFRALGLEGLGDDYFQPFDLQALRFKSIRFEVNGVPLRLGRDYVPADMSGSGSVRSARIADAGSGLMIPDRKISDYAGVDPTGAIVVIDERIPEKIKLDTTIDREFLGAELRVEVAKILNAKGVILLVDRLTSGEYAPIAGIPVIKVRRDAFPAGARNASIEVRTSVDDVTTQNVIARIPGSTVPDSTIIICGHYDHLGSLDDSTWFPGANDNASGIAMMLSLARHFKEHPLRYSIIFIAFSGEERGLLGSGHFVEHPLVDLGRVRFLINLDMAASGREGIMAVGGSDFPEEYALLCAVSDSIGLKEVRKRPNTPNSDHFFFLRDGVRGFYIYPFTGLQPYHHAEDTPETLEWDVLLRLREIVRRFLEGM